MRHRNPVLRRCTYLVVIEDDAGDLTALASYLSELNVGDCDVVVVDTAPLPQWQEHRRMLRWVGRHVSARAKHRSPEGALDPIRIALDLASCEKVIIADPNVRYDVGSLDEVCMLLDVHEVVEPQDYFHPLPWWGSIEAGRMLVHRGIAPLPDHGATFGIRRSALRGLRTIDTFDAPGDDPVRRLAAVGAEVYSAANVFVRRLPPALEQWIDDLPRRADDELSMPLKTAFFLALIPLAMLLATFGGMRIVTGYTGAIAFGTMALAIRGRAGASAFFPLHVCLAAPLWIFGRSVSVYWALLLKMRASLRDGSETLAPRTSATLAAGESGARSSR